jgi:hypothetical protein
MPTRIRITEAQLKKIVERVMEGGNQDEFTLSETADQKLEESPLNDPFKENTATPSE